MPARSVVTFTGGVSGVSVTLVEPTITDNELSSDSDSEASNCAVVSFIEGCDDNCVLTKDLPIAVIMTLEGKICDVYGVVEDNSSELCSADVEFIEGG